MCFRTSLPNKRSSFCREPKRLKLHAEHILYAFCHGLKGQETQFCVWLNLVQQIALNVVLHHRVIATGVLHHLRLIEEVAGAEGDGGQAWRGDGGDVAKTPRCEAGDYAARSWRRKPRGISIGANNSLG